MNVFEDLIVELKDENLLEGTVLDLPPLPIIDNSPDTLPEVDESVFPTSDFELPLLGFSEVDECPTVVADGYAVGPVVDGQVDAESLRKKVVDEISSLQMVGQVLAGIEREYLNTVPRDYDDLNAKKALHRFVQASGHEDPAEYAQAEAELQHEIAEWFAALVARDRGISTAAVRRYCENSRPPLSSQALIAMARFYRNAPYLESVRAKFDFVLTRLFCRDIGDDRRVILFERAEMTEHIRTFYHNWSSVSNYNSSGNAEAIQTAVGRFESLISEAEQADSFDRLTQDDFFDRIHKFKESLCELFFTAEVAAAAIECNVRIGNTFVDLLVAERGRDGLAAVEERYGYAYNQVISQTAGKTLHLLDVVKSAPVEDVPTQIRQTPAQPASVKSAAAKQKKSTRFELFSVNKWLLGLTVVIAIAGVFLYVNVDTSIPADVNVVEAGQVDLKGTELNSYFRTGRAGETTLYLISRPEWNKLDAEKQKELMETALILAETHAAKQVQVVDQQGKSVGFASRGRVELQP